MIMSQITLGPCGCLFRRLQFASLFPIPTKTGRSWLSCASSSTQRRTLAKSSCGRIEIWPREITGSPEFAMRWRRPRSISYWSAGIFWLLTTSKPWNSARPRNENGGVRRESFQWFWKPVGGATTPNCAVYKPFPSTAIRSTAGPAIAPSAWRRCARERWIRVNRNGRLSFWSPEMPKSRRMAIYSGCSSIACRGN
jgi:hypothetical protein